MSSDRIDYYPIRISPGRPVWEVDWWVRVKLGLSTIKPPIEYRWRNASGRKNAPPKGKVAVPAKPSKPVAAMTLWRRERTGEALERAVAANPEEEQETKRSKGKDKSQGRSGHKVRRPTAIVPCYIYPGFERGCGWEDYRALKTLSDDLGWGIQGLPQYWDPQTQDYAYYALSPAQVRWLEEVTEGDGLRARTQVHKSLGPGDAVKITQEAWAGHEGKFVRVDRDYAKVLIHIFGSLQIVSVPLGAVERA
jgi:hypothetical protein